MSVISPTDADIPLDPDAGAEGPAQDRVRDDSFWLGMAEENFTTGRNYQNASLTDQWERGADHFNNRHFRRSAYRSKLYRGRSRLFRPMTRAAERAGAAQFAIAMFSNQDIVDVQPANQNDDEQLFIARMMKNLLQYHLTHSIKWFLTCMGAWQDTRVYGPCTTYTTWEFIEKETKQDVPIEGTPGFSESKKAPQILVDRPVIEMIPPEGILIDPACDWRDPVNTSPYTVRLVPMYLVDVLDKMKRPDKTTGKPQWKTISQEQLMSTKTDRYNTVRQAREGDNRPDKDDSQDRPEFKIIWMHENFVRLEGEEMVYWTAGTQYLVTDPVPRREVYTHGMHPITYGFSIIETHKFSPSSATELIACLQAGVNDIANLRLDNIRLALNKRYIIRRGAAVDLEALMMSVPGGGIFTDNPERDVKIIETRDVTASSYKEQERLETESNDITGTFMGGAVQNNRSLNETVGGMEMVAAGSNAIGELDFRTFSESWMKPQLNLLMEMLKVNESDITLFKLAFDGAIKSTNVEIPEGEDEAATFFQESISKLRTTKLYLNINVGLGATSAQRKSQTLTNLVNTISQNEDQRARMDWDEVTKEMFAIEGYQDGDRFLKSDDKEQELTEEDLNAAYQEGAEAAKDQVKMEDIASRERTSENKLQLEELLGFAKIASAEGISLAQLEKKLDIEIIKDKTRRDTAAAQSQNVSNELEFKRTTGKPGI